MPEIRLGLGLLGLSQSYATTPTKGYSWENDLWSETTINKTASRLILATDNIYSRITPAVKRGMSRLRFLCRLDFSSRIHETPLFKKNRKSCGIGIDGNCFWGIPITEVNRLIEKYKSSIAYRCTYSKKVHLLTRDISTDRIVQGHLKHSLVCSIIAASFNSAHTKCHLSHQTILNAGLSCLRENPRECLGEETYQYYEQGLQSLCA